MLTNTHIIQKLRTFFQNHPVPELAAVYLFGSRASGGSHRLSDVDIGLILKPGTRLSSQDIIALSLELDVKLSPLETDVKVLNGLPVHIAHNMLRQAQVIFSADEIADAEFREHLVEEYFEIRPLLDEFYKSL
ncbi:MAG: hypothetical protein RBG13Loki_1276 [Promethearchaeota archaeon CR_4]|nr:MAG: hypothetical protein RBG13Loki_1276 [Candidatus Lokiarchaeota archaeon CR_4]